MVYAVLGVYILSCVGAVVRSWELSSVDWAQLSKFHLKMETKSYLRNVVFKIKIGRWIMPRNIIFVLMYHRHKLLDLICKVLTCCDLRVRRIDP
jgi:hypothetical protein